MVKPKPGISWVWRSLLHGRELLKSKGRWSISSEVNIDIARDHWLAFGELATVRADVTSTKVHDLIDQSSHSWNVEALDKL